MSGDNADGQRGDANRKIGMARGLALGAVLLGGAMMIPGTIDLVRSSEAEAESSAAFASPSALPSAADFETRSESAIEWDSEPIRSASEGDVGPEEAGAFDCMLLPWDRVAIRSPVTGRLDAIHVERSDFVEAGQLLAELDAGLARAELEVAAKRASMDATVQALQARRDLSEERAERAARLLDQRAMARDAHDEIQAETAIAGFELEEAKDQHQLARLEHERANAEFERRRIRSPIDGIVVERNMSTGEVVDEETILDIAKIDPLRVEVVLPADRFGTIETEMRALVTPEIAEDAVRVATVRVVDRLIDSASGTFGAILELPNPDLALPSGLRCEVQFLRDEEAGGEELPAAPVPSARLETADADEPVS